MFIYKRSWASLIPWTYYVTLPCAAIGVKGVIPFPIRHHAICSFKTLCRFAQTHESISDSTPLSSTDSPISLSFVADDVSLLVVTLDTNPFFWSTFPFPFSEFLSQVTTTTHISLPIRVLNCGRIGCICPQFLAISRFLESLKTTTAI